MGRLVYDAGTGNAMTLDMFIGAVIAAVQLERSGVTGLADRLPTFNNLEPLAARMLQGFGCVCDARLRHYEGPEDQGSRSFNGPCIAAWLCDSLDAAIEYLREIRRIAKSDAPALEEALQEVWRGEATMDAAGDIYLVDGAA